MGETLYERLGGLESIRAVVDDFVARSAADDRINKKFARTDVDRLKRMLIDQVCEASGGPCVYTGRDMKDAHLGMAVTAGEFDATVQNLVATLDKFGVPEGEQGEILAVLGPMRGDIVEMEIPATGTELPASFEPAPPLPVG